jgi:septal ring factor EnvC (AmiA/AmiB activator)
MTQIHLERHRRREQGEMVAFPAVPAPAEDPGSHSAYSEVEDGAAILYLVYRAAEALTAAEDRAADSEERAETLASRTAQELKEVEQRLRAAAAERQALESKVIEAHDRIQEYEVALKDSESRNAVAEAKLTVAERRALEAETRANAARAALVRIEEAIRTHLLRSDQPNPNKIKAAA